MNARPPSKLGLALLLVALVGSLIVWSTSQRALTAQRQSIEQRLNDREVQRLVERVSDDLRFALAVEDESLVRQQAVKSLADHPGMTGIRIQTNRGTRVEVGDFDSPDANRYTTRRDIRAAPADPALLWGLASTRPPVSVGTIEIVASDPAQFGGATATTWDLPLGLLVGLATTVTMFTGVALWIRHRLHRLVRLTEQISCGTDYGIARIEGRDEVAFIAASLQDIGGVVREQITRVHDRNATLLRDVTLQEDQIQRQAQLASVLVAPMGSSPSLDAALEMLAEQTDTGFAMLFLARGGALTPAVSAVGCPVGIEPDLEIEELDRDLPCSLPALEPGAGWLKAADRNVPLPHVIACPLRFRGELQGVLVLARPSEMPERERAYLVDAARPMAIALANQNAYFESIALAGDLEVRNEELARQRDKLEVVNRLRGQFVANMSHELRTPLNAIMGYAELIEDEMFGSITEGQRDAVVAVQQSARHLLELVNQVLDLSAIESGQLRVDPRPCDIVSVVRQSVSLASAVARAKPYVPVFHPEDPAPTWIETDPERVHQIVTNLLQNAIKFTEEGTVEVQMGIESGGGNRLFIEVRDSGIGIADSDLALIFEEFRQVDATSTRARDGVGLGLAISRRLAVALGGSLEVRSELGDGSSFTLYLPNTPAAPVLAQAS